MSGFPDWAFSLEGLDASEREALDAETLAALDYLLRVEGWRERGRRLRDLTGQLSAETRQLLRLCDRASRQVDRGGR